MAARFQRLTASPSAIRKLVTANDQIDARPVLSQIRRPTLIIQRRGDRVTTVHNGRYLADHVPGAVYLEVPGGDHYLYASPADDVVDAVCHFASSESPGRPAADRDARWLATVLFIDIVGSTDIAARAIRCAAATALAAKALGFEIRAELHTGEVPSDGERVSGLAVHVGARVLAQAGAGDVLPSSTTRDLVAESGIFFEERGAHTLKGAPVVWHLYRAIVG